MSEQDRPQEQPPTYGAGQPPTYGQPTYQQPQYQQPQPGSSQYPPQYAPGAYPPGSYPAYPGQEYRPPPRNGLGVTALVLGLVALLAAFAGFLLVPIVVALLAGVLAVCFGIAGRRRATRGEASNGAMSIVGVVLGVLGILGGLLWIWFWVAVLVPAAEKCQDVPQSQQQQCVQDNLFQ